MRETAAPARETGQTRDQAKGVKFLRNFWQFRTLTLMLVPAALVLLLNNYLPMFGLFIAFKKINYIDGIWGSPWSGFENFTFLFNNGSLWRIVRNTVGYSLTFMVVNLILSVAIALALNELRSRIAIKSYQSFLIMPHFLSMIIISYLVYAFLHPTQGFMNATILKWFDKEPVSWYMVKDYWPFILTFVSAWKGVGIGAVIFIAAIAGIDPEYYEAAVIDGASKWKQMMHITLPSIMPIIIIITILNMGHVFNSDFGLFYQVPLDSGVLYPVTDTVDTYVYRVLTQMNDIGMSSAASMVQSILGFIMVFVTNGVVRRINSDQALF
ncbi:ABC transporter permease [Paenibacillus sp. Soil766]|uniref:ABC transporter permease n=1 Tax=Paenibacillus sp. Soil766 TaxID=1736404 RepID=UPI000AEB4254|nr:ABC transporter permease subunit [Paenibacillus sp. Soil766]